MPRKQASKQAVALPNEIWLEIFSKVDTACLRDLSLVCKHWNELIFTHMAGRFVLNFNMEQEKFPRKSIGMVPNRHYRHLSITSFRLDSLDYLLEIVKRLAVDLDSLKLHLVTLDCQLLQQLLGLCTRIKKLQLLAQFFENGEKQNTRNRNIPSVEIVQLDVKQRVSTFKPISLENALLPCIRNVQDLNIVVHNQQDLAVLESLAPQLNVLKVTVSGVDNNEFFEVRLPELMSLDLYLEHMEDERNGGNIEVTFERKSFQQFLLGCQKVRNVLIDCDFDEELLCLFFKSLPEVRTLKLYSVISTEHISLVGLEKMVHLKELSLRCLLTSEEVRPIIPMPTVKQVNLDEYVTQAVLVNTLRRFPNIQHLTFPIRRYISGDLEPIAELTPQLKHLEVFDFARITPEFINDVTRLVNLTTLTIQADVFSRGNFRLLSNIIVLPTLRSLTVVTASNIPINISRAVAAKNPSCKLTLNEVLIRSSVPRVPASRKRSVRPLATSNQSEPSTDESQHSVSGSSTS